MRYSIQKKNSTAELRCQGAAAAFHTEDRGRSIGFSYTGLLRPFRGRRKFLLRAAGRESIINLPETEYA